MINEYIKTGVLALLAVVLSASVLFLSLKTKPTQTEDSDEHTLFFPELKDPGEITGLEVRVFNDSTTKVDNFKVEENAEGKWIIPSHHNYPAEAKTQLGKTVRSFMDLKKDALVAKTASQHETFGVVDPDEPETEQLGGRGRKIIFRNKAGKICAQYIIGKKVEGQEDQHYVRVPGEKRVYQVKFKPELSTQFGDWIDKDLLGLNPLDVDKVVVNNYSIDETKLQSNPVQVREQFSLTRKHDEKGIPQELILDGLKPSEEMNKSNAADLSESLGKLEIVGVRDIQEYLKDVHVETSTDGKQFLKVPSLQDLGFFMTRDRRIFCNEGEVLLLTKDNLLYTLRFGELAGGEGEALTSGVDPASEAAAQKSLDKTKAENRYLWVSVEYKGEIPADGTKNAAQKKCEDLESRFQAFFFVISDNMVAKIRRKREDLTQPKTPTTPDAHGPAQPTGTEGNMTPPEQAPVPAHPPMPGGGAEPAIPVPPAPAPAPANAPVPPNVPVPARQPEGAVPPAVPPAAPPAAPPAPPVTPAAQPPAPKVPAPAAH